MRIPRVYFIGHLSLHQEIELSAQASAHVTRVLRMQMGEKIILFNGDGNEYLGEITAIVKGTPRIILQQQQKSMTESPLRIHLGQGISRGERMDYAIQKATELGVDKITPIFTEHCEVKLAEDRCEKRRAHWQQVAISACEQSGRCRVPTIALPCSLMDWFKQIEGSGFVCDTAAVGDWPTLNKIGSSVSVLIGPEGGLSDDEIASACAKDFYKISLGPRVLRTETAPVVALTLLQSRYGDLRSI